MNTCRNCAENLQNKSSTILKSVLGNNRENLRNLQQELKRALWFVESYGLSIQSLKLTDPNEKALILDFGTQQHNTKSKLQHIPREGKEKIKMVLHIIDRFCIGDVAYYALSVQANGLPKGYLIKLCRNKINKLFSITRTPGVLVGGWVSEKS